MDTAFNFTKASIEGLPSVEKRKRFRDTKLDGLVLEVSPTGLKSFRVYKKIKGRNAPVSVTLGRYPGMSIENARKQALSLLDELNSGINPNEKQRAARKIDVTLQTVFDDYIATKQLKAATLRGYQGVMNTHLKPYAKKPLRKIDETVVKQIHGKASQTSPGQADLAMRFLRALFNYAKYEYRGLNGEMPFQNNPVQILSHLKLWNNPARRQTRLTRAQLPAWFRALDMVREDGDHFAGVCCDLVEMALLTGLRRGELLSLTWGKVNLQERTYYLDRTKNGYPLELPISDHLLRIFQRRYKERVNDVHVFSVDNVHGVVREPKKVINRIEKVSGVAFMLHDLRRTFSTTAESLSMGSYTIKRLLNHRTQRNDVTGGYMVLTPEELREPAQQIENKLLQLAGRKADVADIDRKLVSLLDNLGDAEKLALVAGLESGTSELAEAS